MGGRDKTKGEKKQIKKNGACNINFYGSGWKNENLLGKKNDQKR